MGDRRPDPWGPVLVVFSATTALLHHHASIPWRVTAGIGIGYGIVLTVKEVRAWARWRRARDVAAATPTRPTAGIQPEDRGDWVYQPHHDGSTEVALVLRGRRYEAVFAPDERPAYRTVISGITETLNGGTAEVDVNQAFARVLGREPFADRGPAPSVLDRVLRAVSR